MKERHAPTVFLRVSASDAGEPLFPDSVGAMRLVRGYMEAFGLNQDELYTVCTKNPTKVVGLELN